MEFTNQTLFQYLGNYIFPISMYKPSPLIKISFIDYAYDNIFLVFFNIYVFPSYPPKKWPECFWRLSFLLSIYVCLHGIIIARSKVTREKVYAKTAYPARRMPMVRPRMVENEKRFIDLDLKFEIPDGRF